MCGTEQKLNSLASHLVGCERCGLCRGRTHTVFTGGVFDGEAKVVRSDVTFRELSDGQIEKYVGLVRPTDRAGAYDVDESGDLIVAGWTGSYENIMGLPVEPLREWGLVK